MFVQSAWRNLEMASNTQIIVNLLILFALIFVLGWNACYLYYTEIKCLHKSKSNQKGE
jgi:hypothetical protein